jgi:hypothetical protein
LGNYPGNDFTRETRRHQALLEFAHRHLAPEELMSLYWAPEAPLEQ